MEDFLGITQINTGSLALPVVRYAIPGGGTEFSDIPNNICGTFYYPESKSSIMLILKSCFIVPNKIVAYSYFTKATINEIAPHHVTLDEYSYYEEPMRFKNLGSGFVNYYIEIDENDMLKCYDLIKSHLTKKFVVLKQLILELPGSIPDYLENLYRTGLNDKMYYIFNDNKQDKDVILFLISYVKYVAIKMMLNGTWNWRINILSPYTLYDQFLCNEAAKRDIDVIIFTTEASTGMYRIRSEILDSRKRDDSYSSLRIKNDPLILKCRNYEKQELSMFLQ